MRNAVKFNEIERPLIIETFSPRIQKDLEIINRPDNLPIIQSLFIHGPTGTGKTIVSIFLYIEIKKKLYLEKSDATVSFVKTSEVFNGLKASFDDPTVSEQDILTALSEVDYLIVDDFGSEKPSDWMLSIFYLLIDRRYEGLKTTIFTSNHSLKEIAVKFGDDRITSRIQRMCKIIKKTKY